MTKILMLILVTLPLLAMFGCEDKEHAAVAEMEKLIQQNLKPGDPPTKIETFFKQHNLPYGFDKFNHRYQSYVPSSEKTDSKGVKSSIGMYIYTNEDGSFRNAEVRMDYTYL